MARRRRNGRSSCSQHAPDNCIVGEAAPPKTAPPPYQDTVRSLHKQLAEAKRELAAAERRREVAREMAQLREVIAKVRQEREVVEQQIQIDSQKLSLSLESLADLPTGPKKWKDSVWVFWTELDGNSQTIVVSPRRMLVLWCFSLFLLLVLLSPPAEDGDQRLLGVGMFVVVIPLMVFCAHHRYLGMKLDDAPFICVEDDFDEYESGDEYTEDAAF